MTLPAAGWFPDPQDATRLRWWDGRTWAADIRAMPTRAEPVVPVVVAPVGPSFSVQTGTVRARPWASGTVEGHRLSFLTFLAAVCSTASVLANPWGACSALAIVVGLVAAFRPTTTGGWRVVSRSVAASAVVVAVATAAVAAHAQLHLF